MPKLDDALKGLKRSMPELDDLSKPAMPRLLDLRLPPIPPNPPIENAKDNYASAFYERLAKMIEEFDESLDDAHEVGVRLVSFGQTVVFHLEDMGYYNPSLITFRGHTENGDPVELIQHVSQISILLTKLPRQDSDEPKEPFGFSHRPEPATEESE